MKDNSMAKLKIVLVVVLYFLFALSGGHVALYQDVVGGADFLLSIVMAIVATNLCVVDAKMRKKPLIHSSQFVIFLFWFIAVPLYFIGTRKLKGLGMVLLHFIGLSAISVFSFYIADSVIS